MSGRRIVLAVGACVCVGALALVIAKPVLACGGFFCQQVPINQAGEQIIFRQDGNMVTAVVLIQYQGNAEDFSWVVPVPGVPELSIGSDLVFSPLELATRPQFNLTVTGDGCPQPIEFLNAPAGDVGLDSTDDRAEDGGVDVLQELAVGPFDTVVVRSDDPEALATWLAENDYDLTDAGPELIEPYVTAGMNFVALRLRQDQGVGDLQPLIMRYESECPMIPIRLTAVAATPDMGVLVWILGESRAVPLNYLHVVPNYTRLNWYSGTASAYVSYQGLITAAMNEAQRDDDAATGQGFATDYAGTDLDYVSQLPTAEPLRAELTRLSLIESSTQYVAEFASGFVFSNSKALEILRRELPLTEGLDEFIYNVPELLAGEFTAEELVTARLNIAQELNDSVIAPLEETLAVFDGVPYMTRLYTTLSADEMTLDPNFSFNPDLDGQPIERNAAMNISCTLGGTEWTLTLGTGTDRDGEVVINGLGDPPGGFSGPPTVDQDALFRSEAVSRSGQPVVIQQKDFPTLRIIGPGAGDGLCGSGTGLCGSGTAGILLLTVFGLRLLRGRRS